MSYKLYTPILGLVLALASRGTAFADTASEILAARASDSFMSLDLPPVFYQQGCLDSGLAQPVDAPNTPFSDRALRTLRDGICLVHVTPSTDAESAEKAASSLSWAQSAGLPMNVQNYATFLEGISYCRIAKQAPRRNLTDAKFCPARKAALNAFQSVSWDAFSVRYRQTNEINSPENETVWATLLNEMTQCYNDVLVEEFDSACGLNADVVNFQSTVDAETEKVFNVKFNSASSPIDAIIKRKIDVSEGVLKKAQNALGVDTDPTALLGMAAYVGSSFDSSQTIIGSLDDRVSKLKDAYKNAILQADEIIGEYTRLQKGLFFDGTKDWSTELANKAKTMNQQVTEAKSPWLGGASRWERAQAVAPQLVAMMNYSTERLATIKSMCQLYFCELLQQTNMVPGGTTQKACVDAKSQPTPGVKNALCPAPGAKAEDLAFKVDATTVNIKELCRAAGFAEKYIKLQMVKPESKACFAAATL